MALSFTDLKKGTVFQLDGLPYKVLEYSHKMMGRGSATVYVKILNLIDGKISDKTFKGSENIDAANVTSRPVQYLYEAASEYHFMDSQNYEQFILAATAIADKRGYIKEGQELTGQFFDGRLINIELPKNTPLKVTQAEDAVRGDTSTTVTKNATLETGLVIRVPAFIKQGDVISVDTTNGTYRERIRA